MVGFSADIGICRIKNALIISPHCKRGLGVTLDISLSIDILAMSVDLLSVTHNYLLGSNDTRLFTIAFIKKL
ncbi:MAG: hypothetical protein ACI97P_002652 [Arcticibacterium sp.]